MLAIIHAVKVLTASFRLAYAGEDLVRLVDFTDTDYIKERVKNFDAAVLGTTFQLERRAVTLNTYEKSVNDKTYELYLDERYGAWENDVPSYDDAIHATIFRNAVTACKEAGVRHLVVVETPRTMQPADFLSILDEVGVAYTYIRSTSELSKDINYTFEKGITNKLGVTRLPVGSSVSTEAETESGQPIKREDLAALVVQSLMTLDWGESRILEVTSTDSTVSSGYGGKKSKQRFDRDWCPNSNLLAEVLSNL